MTRIDPNTMYPLEDVMALAVMAHRINDDYLVHGVTDTNDRQEVVRRRFANKDLIKFGLGISKLPSVDLDGNPDFRADNVADDEDLEQAQEIISYYQGLMMKAISGKINTFEERVLHVVRDSEVSVRDIGVVASLPKSYARSVEREQVEETQRALSVDSQHIGAIGDTVEIDLNIMRMNYIQKLDCHVVNGKDEKGNLVVFFTSKDREFMDKEQVKIRARVKRQQVSSYHGGNETVLNYVKVV
jgi:hypothetical protein